MHLNRLLFVALLIVATSTARAQTGTPIQFTGFGDWNTGLNWQFGFVPDGGFDEYAVIGSGDLVTLGSMATPDPGAVEISGGVLNIETSGSLLISSSIDRRLVVTGTSFLTINSGGEIRGIGPATIGAGAKLTVIGSVGFEADSLELGGVFEFLAGTGSSSPLLVSGTTTLGGTLTYGAADIPALGDAWTLIDSGSVTGSFSAINVSGLDPGLAAEVVAVPGGLGTQVKLVVTGGLTGPAWNVNASGFWGTAANWTSNPVAPTAGQDVLLGDAITSPAVVTVDVPVTAGAVVFMDIDGYTVAAGAGTLTLNDSAAAIVGDHTISAPITLSSASSSFVAGECGSLSVTGPVGMGSSATLVLAGGGDGEIGAIDDGGGGAGQVVKRGSGTWTIGTGTSVADDFHAGTTTVEAGTLKVKGLADAGELQSAAIEVQSGATLDVSDFSTYSLQSGQELGGGGEIDANSNTLQVFSDNVVTPGDSAGTLSVTGNLTLNGVEGSSPSGGLEFELSSSPGGSNDQIAVSGDLVSNAGGGGSKIEIRIQLLEFALAGGTTYELITFGGTHTGSASDFKLVGSAPNVALAITVDSDSVNLEVTGAGVTVVTTTVDELDATSSAGAGVSLREAIRDANAMAGAETIFVPAGTYHLTIPGADNDGLVGDLDVLDAATAGTLTIIGEGSGTVINAGTAGFANRSFQALAGADLTLEDLVIEGGTTVRGGGLVNDGSTTLRRVIFRDNSTETTPFSRTMPSDPHSENDGGAIRNSSTGTLVIEECVFDHNEAGDNGGAIYNNNGDVTVTDTTFRDNEAGDAGGALRGETNGTQTFERCTFVGNHVDSGGGAIANYGVGTYTNCTFVGNDAYGNGGGLLQGNDDPLELRHCTVMNNTCDDPSATGQGGAGIRARPIGTVTLVNTIVYGNLAAGGAFDIESAYTATGNNIVGVSKSGGVVVTPPAGVSTSDPQLGVLGDYGGLTETMPPLAGGPAVDGADNSAIPAGVTTDQRGAGRIFNGTVDLGAVESDSFATLYADFGPLGTGDENLNGLGDYFEYAAGFDPRAAGYPAIGPVLTGDAGGVTYTHSIRTNVGDVFAEYEYSTTLLPGGWMPLVPGTHYTLDDSDPELLKLELLPGFLSGKPELFLRHRFSTTEP